MANISIIGAGNLAWSLAIALETAGHSIHEIYSRSLTNAEKISKMLYDSKATNNLDFSDSPSELFILAVSDDAINLVSEQLILPDNVILVHTSGAKNIKELNPVNQTVKKGVFYPLMTFTYGIRVDFEIVPICIEAFDTTTSKYLGSIGHTISKKVLYLDEQERLALHISAVFSCNFTNHFWALSKEILDIEGLNFGLLKPLVQETLNKAFKAEHPADVQTGPAVRDDRKTMQKHILYLREELELDDLYQSVSESINKWHDDQNI